MTTADRPHATLVDSIRRERDEILLKLHLGAADARDEFGRLEGKWHSLEEHAKARLRDAEDIVGELADTAGDIAEDIRDGYKKVRKHLPETPAKEDVDKLVERVKRERDELNVQVHLGEMEVRDQWEVLEKKREDLLAKTAPARREAGEAAEDVGAAVRQLGEEILKGYDRIRRKL